MNIIDLGCGIIQSTRIMSWGVRQRLMGTAATMKIPIHHYQTYGQMKGEITSPIAILNS